jgi:hypothetical protein
MKRRYRSEVARLSRSVAQNRSLLRSADGRSLLPLIPARLADAVIGLGVAVLGAGSALGARHQGEHVPLAAVAILAAMGLILYPRRRFPAPCWWSWLCSSPGLSCWEHRWRAASSPS